MSALVVMAIFGITVVIVSLGISVDMLGGISVFSNPPVVVDTDRTVVDCIGSLVVRIKAIFSVALEESVVETELAATSFSMEGTVVGTIVDIESIEDAVGDSVIETPVDISIIEGEVEESDISVVDVPIVVDVTDDICDSDSVVVGIVVDGATLSFINEADFALISAPGVVGTTVVEGVFGMATAGEDSSAVLIFFVVGVFAIFSKEIRVDRVRF